MGGSIRSGLLLAASLMLSSCTGGANSFACQQDSDCQAGGMAGFCEPNGFCSFPDEQCESGRRYGAQGGGATGLCVPPGGTATHTGGASTSSDSTSSGDASGSQSGTDSTSNPTSDTPATATTSNGNTSSGETSAITDGQTTSSTTEPTDSSVSDESTTSGSSASTTDSSAGSTTGPQEVVVEVLADIAECTDPVNNDPDLCETNAGVGNMTVDGQESVSGQATTGWLRFSLGPDLAGVDIVSVELQLTVTDDVDADSSTSGELHQTDAFDLAGLSVAQPVIEDTVVGADQGGVTQGDLVTFDLPVSLVEGRSVLHLAIVNSTSAGVNYWNLAGAAPPRLIVTTLQ